MNIKKTTNELCVEVYATNNKGTTMIIREVVGEIGVYATYLKIFETLTKIDKNVWWNIDAIRTISSKNTYYNKI